jgi:hypothetical protein
MTGAELQEELQGPSQQPVGYDEVEALLQRYQAEKARPVATTEAELRLPPLSTINGRRAGTQDPRPSGGSVHGEVLRSNGSREIPPASRGEVDALRTENAELKSMVAELKQYLESNDPEAWEERVRQAEAMVIERDQLIEAQKQHIDQWQEQLKTHRFVPSDDDLSHMADDMEKERCQLTKERKDLEEGRAQLDDDEDALMKQMREMEMAMARERADLARQRSELQRLQVEIKHELELLERGDASVKERLAQFQRRQAEALRPAGPPRQSPTPATPDSAPPAQLQRPQPRESGVFKRLFGQGG